MYLSDCMIIDSSDKTLNAYFIPNILKAPRGQSGRQVVHPFQVHPSLQPSGRPGNAVYKEGKMKGRQGWWVCVQLRIWRASRRKCGYT